MRSRERSRDHERSFTRGYVNASLAADVGRHQIKFGGDVVTAPVREALDYEITDGDYQYPQWLKE